MKARSTSLAASRTAAAARGHLAPADDAQWLACGIPCQRIASTLAGHRALTRGRCGSLRLHRRGLSPHTSCRSPGAPVHPIIPSIGWRTGQSATQKRPSVHVSRTPLPRFRLGKTRPTRLLARVARKPQRIDFLTPPRQRSSSLRRSARPGDARRQRERWSPAGPLPPPLRRKRPRSRPLIGRRPRRRRRSDENRFAARPLFR